MKTDFTLYLLWAKTKTPKMNFLRLLSIATTVHSRTRYVSSPWLLQCLGCSHFTINELTSHVKTKIHSIELIRAIVHSNIIILSLIELIESHKIESTIRYFVSTHLSNQVPLVHNYDVWCILVLTWLRQYSTSTIFNRHNISLIMINT